MRSGGHLVLRAASRLQLPLIVMFALAALATRPAGEGVGFMAGLGAALALALHALVFGAAPARTAFPPPLARVIAALGLALVIVGAGAPGLAYAEQMVEAGVFAVTGAGAALILTVLIGRAPTLRDDEW